MFLTLVAAACVFFTMGLDMSGSTQTIGSCPHPTTAVNKENIKFIGGHTDNCTCKLGDGKYGKYPDGTPCFDGHYHIGNCSKGVCQAPKSTYGCAGKNGSEPGSKVDHVLCTFECKNDQGKIEWAYSSDGTPCVNEDDPENKKNGTCKFKALENGKNETICVPNDQLHLFGC
uniref:Putative secreted protein n=1 Tax=Amblyomma cajennense TaxID=34607 RepID=A0A023FQC6_AMBCJ